jgi:4-amino-4-deoxy-L-arabinose transferase-like glycosyltransferase
MPITAAPEAVHELPIAERIEQAINSRPNVVMGVVAVFFLINAYILASVRLFWFDEFITIYIARQGSIRAIWHLLANGADPNPPLSHLLVLGSMRLLGSSEAAIRTPFVLASLIGILCLFEFIRRHVGPLYAAAGVFFYVTTHAFDYAFEARSYSLLLCFSMLSLMAWRWTIESPHRKLALALMTLSLMLGISSNYYGVLAFFPIAAGEALYSFEGTPRRIRLQVWLALALASVSLLFYLPLINVSIKRFAPYAWNRPTSIDFLPDTYTFILEAIFWLAVICVVGAALVYVYERTQLGIRRPRVLPNHEFAAIAVLLAYPVLGYLIAVLRAGMISSRFVIPFVYGVAIAVAVSGYQLFRRNPVTSLLFLACCVSWCIFRVAENVADYNDQRGVLLRLTRVLPRSGTLVVPDSLLVLPLHYYAPPEAAARMVMPLDIQDVRKYKREDSAEQNFAAAAAIYPVPQIPLETVLRNNPQFYIVAPPENWLLRVMEDYRNPAEELPNQKNYHALRGFFSLSFGDARVFREHFDSDQYAGLPAQTNNIEKP